MNNMKQVYAKEAAKEETSRISYMRGGVLLFGFLVWLLAVTDSFGQTDARMIGKRPSLPGYGGFTGRSWECPQSERQAAVTHYRVTENPE